MKLPLQESHSCHWIVRWFFISMVIQVFSRATLSSETIEEGLSVFSAVLTAGLGITWWDREQGSHDFMSRRLKPQALFRHEKQLRAMMISKWCMFHSLLWISTQGQTTLLWINTNAEQVSCKNTKIVVNDWGKNAVTYSFLIYPAALYLWFVLIYVQNCFISDCGSYFLDTV